MASDYRQLCFDEHGQKCIRCGSENQIVAHHKNENRTDNSPEDLAPLCTKCHRVWHLRDEWNSFEEFVASDIRTGVPEYITEADANILEVLDTGRVTPQYVANETGVSRTYASERLKRLLEHAHVNKVAPGLYELVDDPREADDA